jgi:uncharacterized protein YbjQ (UPF0145 family)
MSCQNSLIALSGECFPQLCLLGGIPLSLYNIKKGWVRKIRDIIITSTDTIPTKKIVKILGNVTVKKHMWSSERADLCYEELRKAAERMSADAVINVAYSPAGTFGVVGSCTGIAFKLEEESLEQYPKCPNCERELPQSDFDFCPFCGKSLKS